MRFEAVFEYERSTKNTHRYQEVVEDSPPVIGTLYVQKWRIGQQPPQRIKVTVETV